MKSSIITLSLISLLMATVGCSSDDEDTINDNNANAEAISNLMAGGNWVITSYVDSGQDETQDYSGYEFIFAADGTLTADNGTTVVNGTWSVSDDDSSDDSDDYDSTDDVDFNIFFATPEIFNELTDDWDIVTRSSTRIELIDISGGNGGTDTLTFEKT